MTIQLQRHNTANTDDISRVGKNNLTLDGPYFMAVTAGIADKAGAATPIVGVNYTNAVFASDNQTVGKKEVKIDPAFRQSTYLVAITGGTVTRASEGSYFNLTNADTVNGASISATTGQLRLERFISATKGEFRIVI